MKSFSGVSGNLTSPLWNDTSIAAQMVHTIVPGVNITRFPMRQYRISYLQKCPQCQSSRNSKYLLTFSLFIVNFFCFFRNCSMNIKMPRCCLPGVCLKHAIVENLNFVNFFISINSSGSSSLLSIH